MLYLTHDKPHHTPWNKGKITGQKPPLKLNEVWAIRIRLQRADKKRDLALFNLALDSKLRSCDLVKLKVHIPAQSFQRSRQPLPPKPEKYCHYSEDCHPKYGAELIK